MHSKVKLTLELIKDKGDVQLDDLVYNKAVDLYLGTFGELFGTTEKDKLLKKIFATSVLDNEVNSGGFDSFFHNSGDLEEFALDGLVLIGANKHADLFEQAIGIKKGEGAELNSKRNPKFDSLDEKYYALENVNTVRIKFIRENLKKFLD